jgi:NIMA (never in mitosis gene a)-related kinase
MATRDNKSLVIKDYIIREKLGTGSYGVVYKVIKKTDKQVCVLKQISLFNMSKPQIEEVKKESNILSSLNNSYIVKYYDSFVESNNLNIIMEYCDGGDLSNYLNIQKKTGKTMSEDKIWKFFIQICLGLTYIHKKSILHRDLKSLNIFLTRDEKVRIGDLGVAKVLSNTTQMANTFVGTPYYLSPEICEEKPYNEKSDIWALGCILYEMTTYKHPFNANNQGALILKILRGKYDPIGKEYSQDLRKMIDLLLEKNHFKRPGIVEVLNNQGKNMFITSYD